MKNIIKIFLIFSFFFLNSQKLTAGVPYYLDFKYVLNESSAGKKAQTNLKNKYI